MPQYDVTSEVNDLTIHMRRVIVGIKAGLYRGVDDDYIALADQLTELVGQIHDFNVSKR